MISFPAIDGVLNHSILATHADLGYLDRYHRQGEIVFVSRQLGHVRCSGWRKDQSKNV